MSLKMINIQKYLFFVMILTFSIVSFAQKNQKFVIVIDAGHGGHDTGARGVADLEKNIALDVALRFGNLIQANYKDVKVVWTRKTDVFLELSERTDISNANHANLFVSVHCNSASNTSASGTETFVMGLNKMSQTDDVSRRENSVVFLEKDKEKYEKFNPNDPEAVIAFEIMNAAYKEQSLRFADLMEKTFINQEGRKSRGVKQGNLHVLRNNASPSVLVEIGFISNQDEGTYLASEEGKQKAAESLYKAFQEYKREYDRRSGVDGQQSNEDKPAKVAETPLVGKKLKVRVMDSKTKFSHTSPQLKGLTDLDVVQEGDNYVYYLGETDLQSRADELLNTVKRKGFSKARIVEVESNKKLEGVQNYRVQFMTSNKKYRDKDDKFNGLTNVLRVKEGGLQKYYYGQDKTMEEAQKTLKQVQEKGFRNSFIVTFNGENPM